MRQITYIVGLIVSLLLQGCFTGIESTPTITSAEVEKVTRDMPHDQTRPIVPLTDSVATWQAGTKQFIVTDNQVQRLFAGTMADTLDLTNRVLTYIGYDLGDGLGNAKHVNLNFSDGQHTFTIPTGHNLDQLSPRYRVPMLIDRDIVDGADNKLRGQRLFIMTMLWYDNHSEHLRQGRQYVPVTITAVKPGNKVLPLRVEFVWNSDTAMVWMSDGITLMPGRNFEALFSNNDPRQRHQSINNKNWDLITCGKIAVNMTKEECQLAMGAPRRIYSLPDQQGLHERWDYDGGRYLYFVDGRLHDFRQ